MNITECVPLAGRGLVARRGHLVALTDGMDAGPDPLLAALTAVAVANGDGAALVLAGTRAAMEHGGRPAWACAGVTFGEEVAVLVHGEAAALVSVDGSLEAQVTASGSMIPVAGTFTGAVVTVRLVIAPPAPPDPRLWLEAGTVFGGGILLTIKQGNPSTLIPNDPYASVAASMRPAVEQAVVNAVLHPSASGPAGPVPAVLAPPGVAPGEVYPEDVLPELLQATRSLRTSRSAVGYATVSPPIPLGARIIEVKPLAVDAFSVRLFRGQACAESLICTACL
jgi:hypothetical protein